MFDNKTVFVSEDCHPQTISVIQTRAEPMGLKIIIGNDNELNKISEDLVERLTCECKFL